MQGVAQLSCMLSSHTAIKSVYSPPIYTKVVKRGKDGKRNEEVEQRRQLLLDGCLLGILWAAGSRKPKLVDRAVGVMNSIKFKSYSDMTAF